MSCLIFDIIYIPVFLNCFEKENSDVLVKLAPSYKNNKAYDGNNNKIPQIIRNKNDNGKSKLL